MRERSKLIIKDFLNKNINKNLLFDVSTGGCIEPSDFVKSGEIVIEVRRLRNGLTEEKPEGQNRRQLHFD
jgi:hypothetical protein